MPSSYSFLLNSQSNSSSSSSENDSKSDQTDDDDDINVGYYKKRTIENENDMLERPSDHEDSGSESDDTDNVEHEHDLMTPSNIPQSYFLTRQLTLYDNDWPKKSSIDETKFPKSIYRDEPTLSETLFIDSYQRRLFSPERSKSLGTVDKKHRSRNIPTSLPSDFTASAEQLHSIPQPDHLQSKSNINSSPIHPSRMNENQSRPISKIPVRTNSSSQSRSRSPALKTITNRRLQSPTIPSKIPVPVSTTSNGAFRFFTSDDRPSPAPIPPPTESTQVLDQTTKKVSPFTPITHSKALPLSKKISSSAGNTPSAKSRRPQLPSTDDEDSETNHLEEADLKLKLKEQKRHGKQTGELLNKLHENYEELLEKYAQAENTIDQLRFQPKIFGENTPPSNTTEGTIHFIHQPKVNIATMRSNGVYHTSSGTPMSSIRVGPSTTTTTTTTPAVKSTSPANSYTVESVFFDEPVPQKIIVQELTTPETIKLDLLIQTKTLSDKMKSFLTLMDANQLSLAEQQQVYESIKDDYEKLLKTLDRTKRSSDLSDLDLDGDLNQELETMKQLLKEIVKRITDNLLGKTSSGSETGRQSYLTRDGSHSSQLSVRSSLCNHADLMDQYQKLLNAVNTGVVEKKKDVKSSHIELEDDSNRQKKTPSHHSSQSDISDHRSPTTKSQTPYVYISGNSDDEQQQQQRSNDTTPVSSMKRIESTPFTLDYIPSTTNNHHRQINEEQRHIHGLTKTTTTTTKKRKSPSKQQIQEYDSLENITKTKQKKHHNHYQPEKELSPTSLSVLTGSTRYSASAMRTRTSDYDSGLGTNNTTKLSRDRLNTSTMDESHYQLLDEEKRRYSDGEQESMSSVSSSRSSGSGATSPRNLSSKYSKRFNTSSLLKQRNENYRRKPSGHSDASQSDIETHITGSFDPLPPPPSYQNRSRRSHHSWQPQRTISHHPRVIPSHRSISIESTQRSPRPQTAPQTSSKTAQYYKMGRKYQSGFIHRQPRSTEPPDAMYKSSFYIDQAHTHRRSQEKLDQKYTQTSNNLFLDPQTGIVYRYMSNNTQPSNITYYQPTSQMKSSGNLYQCAECGSITTYHHRHHINSTNRRVINDVDDPGYESGNRKLQRHRRYVEYLTSSDSDPDENRAHLDMSILNEAYDRARKVQHHSQNLSKRISRQLKLVLTTI